MSVFHNNALIGASGGTAAAADAAVATKSLRFNASDTAYLNRTPSSAGNRRTFTFACWFKLVETSGTRRYLFSAASANTGSPYNWILGFAVLNGQLTYTNAANDIYKTDAVLRDFSAWYHCVFAVDTTQATASDRVKIYLNGALMDITDQNHGGADPPSQNTEYPINNTTAHAVGAVWNHQNTDLSGYFNGYIADAYLIDGSALDPTSFGAYDSNGVWQAAAYSGTYGTNGFHLAFSDSTSTAALGTDSSGNSNTFTVNNLAAGAPGLSTADQGFGVLTYTGNATARNISGLSFAPDLVIIKSRSDSGFHHYWIDRVRGTGKNLFSNLTEGEQSADRLSSFNSDGIGLTDHSGVNKSGSNFVAWCFKAGGSASSNTDGTITSSVSANDTYGFSIINHTGTGAAGTFGHGLSSAPDWLLFKNREATDNWFVWHSALNSATTGGVLNSTNAFFTNGANELNSTLPTDSVIHVGNNLATNGNGQEVICYAWTEKSGFSKFGSYTGNGSTDGPTVTLGFKPKFILLRSTSASRGWCIYDTVRDTSTTNDNNLFFNNNSAESSDSSHNITILSDGFKLATTSVNRNGNGETYIYAAFADVPNGSDIDSLFDVPTNGDQTDTGAGGEVSGNYATMNSLVKFTSDNVPTFANGSLKVTGSSGTSNTVSTIGTASGKFYFEVTLDAAHDTNSCIIGLGQSSVGYSNNKGIRPNGNYNGTITSGSAFTFFVGDTIGIAFEPGVSATFFKNNNEASFVATCLSGDQFAWMQLGGTTVSATFNFGQRPFVNQSVPSNFKALCTTNLPTPTIADGRDYFDAKLWTGNSTDQRAITGYQFSPDWVWIKRRNASYAHPVMDTVRGLNSGHAGVLYTNATNSEDTGATSSIRSFNSDGFNLGTDGGVNFSGSTYVGWAWDAGSSTASNTNGSITSSVRANQSAGFSIVTYTGTGSNATVGHGLNAAPEMVILKGRNFTDNWRVYHKDLDATAPANYYLMLEKTNGKSANSTNIFNQTMPTSSVFSLGTDSAVNGSTRTMVAYCFAPVAGYSSALSWEGNGSSDGVFIHTGFRVAWFLWKRTDGTANWYIYDSVRSTFNVVNDNLEPNTSDAENTLTSMNVDFLSNGIKVRGSDGDINGSSADYIGFAFAENPFQANGGLAR